MAASAPVSIGMPVYNAARHLQQSLDSLLGQTYGDFELVISDNASTDETETMCRDYATRDSRVRYVRHAENRGAVWNFNQSFLLSRGRYFKWAASDDICRPLFLDRCVDLLDQSPEVIWCHSLTNHLDADGNEIGGDDDSEIPPGQMAHSLLPADPDATTRSRCSPRPSRRFGAVVLGTTWCSDSYGLMRADALKKTRLILPCYGAEKVLIAELSLLGRFGEVPERLFLQRVHADSSGMLPTAKRQIDYVAPGAGQTFSGTRLRLLQGFMTAAFRSHLPLAEKLRCLEVMGRYVLQVRKWKRVASQLCGRRGMALRATRNLQANGPKSSSSRQTDGATVTWS